MKPIERIFNELQETLISLYSRYQEEKKYEDINDYKIPIIPVMERYHGTIINMNKKPFGFTFKFQGKIYQIKVTSTKYSLVEL
jgi:hypothetical protein